MAGMAFVSVLAIIGIVLVGAGVIAFLINMVIGAFDKGDKADEKSGDLLNYTEYKKLEESTSKEATQSQEYNFEAINEAKAKEEEALVASEDDKKDVFELDDSEDDLDQIEARLAKESEEKAKAESTEDVDDIDIDNIIEEISNDIVDEEQKNSEEEAPKMDEELESYTIDDYLNKEEAEDQNEEDAESETETSETEEVVTEETTSETEQVETEEPDEDEGGEEVKVTTKEESSEEVVEESEETEDAEATVDEKDKIIKDLKEQLDILTQQLNDVKVVKTEITIDMTEEDCLQRLATLDERLKYLKKEYRNNMKEYRPLKKVMHDLERYQTKLRRKEAVVVKKRVSLYGVNNYVDIDDEKKEELSQEVALVDSLRESIKQCEEVIEANKDRFPVLENTNNILEEQIANIESDIESTNAVLEKIREKNGNGSDENK